MANSYVEYSGDDTTGPWNVTFPYINKAHVRVWNNGVEDTTFTWPSDTQITTTSAVATGTIVHIGRSSSQSTKLVDYQDAAVLTEATLDLDANQGFYMAQEAIDSLDRAIKNPLGTQTWDALSKRIINVGEPTGSADAATKYYVDSSMAAGGASATTLTEGYVELATQGEVDAGTDTGDTGPLVVQPSTLAGRTATESLTGIAEIATQAETDTGTDDTRIVTPKKLAGRAATETLAGVAEIATQAETDAGTDDARIVTPAKLAGLVATESLAGILEVGTQAEVDAGTLNTKIVTPVRLDITLSNRNIYAHNGFYSTSVGTSTYVDYTSIPSWATSLLVSWVDASFDGTAQMILQLGDSGGIETTGYAGTAFTDSANLTSSVGFGVSTIVTPAASVLRTGFLRLWYCGSNYWMADGYNRFDSGLYFKLMGRKQLSDTLDRVRLTSAGGTANFDNGTWTVQYFR